MIFGLFPCLGLNLGLHREVLLRDSGICPTSEPMVGLTS